MSQYPVDDKKCDECETDLKKIGVSDQPSFRKWSLKNHPDKGGDEKAFQQYSSCFDMIVKNDECNPLKRKRAPSPNRPKSTPKKPKSPPKKPKSPPKKAAPKPKSPPKKAAPKPKSPPKKPKSPPKKAAPKPKSPLKKAPSPKKAQAPKKPSPKPKAVPKHKASTTSQAPRKKVVIDEDYNQYFDHDPSIFDYDFIGEDKPKKKSVKTRPPTPKRAKVDTKKSISKSTPKPKKSTPKPKKTSSKQSSGEGIRVTFKKGARRVSASKFTCKSVRKPNVNILKQIAKQQEISGYSKMKREDLCNVIKLTKDEWNFLTDM